MPQKIILVDDDRNITTSLKMVLEAEGYEVKVSYDGEDGLRMIRAENPDLCVSDIKMPRMDGLELLIKLREFSQLPVILLTSKDDEVDELFGLRLGADDYITKPFSQRLLIERIRTLLRRAAGMSQAQNTPEKQTLAKHAEDSADKTKETAEGNAHMIVRGELTMDENRHLTQWKGQVVNLTVTEYLLIKCLAVSPGYIKSRDQLITAAYGENIFVDDRIIDTHIKRIRRKFRDLDRSFDGIETLYGAGYRYKPT